MPFCIHKVYQKLFSFRNPIQIHYFFFRLVFYEKCWFFSDRNSVSFIFIVESYENVINCFTVSDSIETTSIELRGPNVSNHFLFHFSALHSLRNIFMQHSWTDCYVVHWDIQRSYFICEFCSIKLLNEDIFNYIYAVGSKSLYIFLIALISILISIEIYTNYFLFFCQSVS